MKKILSLVMVFVMALCLGGCGQDIPKADYTFTTEELIDDCFQKHGTDIGESVLTAEKFYFNKRIELIGFVYSNSKEYKFKGPKFAVLHGRVSDKMAIWFKIVFRNEEDRNKFLEKEYVKLSARFKMLSGGEDSGGKYVVIFEFDDGIFLEKL